MTNLNARNIPALAILISGSLLVGAYLFQYVGGLAPCQMCYWQRYAHFAILAVAVLALIIRMGGHVPPVLHRLMVWLIAAGFLASFALAFWHMGVEYKWWEGPKTCMAAPDGPISSSDILDALSGKVKMPACSDAPWHFGLSMAGWNAVISLAGGLYTMATGTKKNT